ncbi:uncharacterized protein LOC123298870 [Chrysoperla carnea]|uniref:uncharacterized protein LOC123298870 n=1 Tax=Chrysoperla carnea TaxID=189513 RepID=UPI001D085503|nr:uncharacterized protein LOC123298870 [Chrysoperla carnea]
MAWWWWLISLLQSPSNNRTTTIPRNRNSERDQRERYSSYNNQYSTNNNMISLIILIMSFIILTLFEHVNIVATAPACRISEFPCRNNRCVRLDRYCDGIDDCGDMSDEPRYCTVCNRTYYGDVGKTYELELGKPLEGRLPFLCHLTFTANGHNHGDIVQLIFDAFNVGRYEPSALDGCPDGYMQLSELGRPFTGGSWCGSSTGYAVYYSETSTITVSVKLFHAHGTTPFEFRLRYKFVSQLEAIVRFGHPSAPLERGQVSPGTYCTRKFEECYRKPCRLQSPNYPGMYPRNVTCYWSLRQKTIPTCKHAMISVRQESAHKMQMKRSISVASLNKTGRALKAWKDCTGERDHLIFYDGGTTNDPVLVKYCGGDWLPRVVSRGPEMLVAFHSSPFSIPLHSQSTPSPLRGFELDVNIIFADSDSLDYSREVRTCEFDVNATNPDSDEIWTRQKGRLGRLVSPRHTLPPNTTCVYRFRGKPDDRIWIYFISYSNHALLPPPSQDGAENNNQTLGGMSMSFNNVTVDACLTRLRLWDGNKIIAEHCDDEMPRLCDHTSLSNVTRMTRPCAAHESYISKGSDMTIEHHTEDGTALHPATFKLKYEFVDTRLGGEAWPGRRGEPCYRVFRKQSKGQIVSPRNVFLFGRGGATNLSCVYRIEAGAGERIRLTIFNISFGDNPSCYTEPDPHTGRARCTYNTDVEGYAIRELRLWEVPWREVRLPKTCFCDNSSLTQTNARPLVFLSSSRVYEIHFNINNMNITEDFRDIYFFAAFEMVRTPDCPRKQRLRGSGGEVELLHPPESRSESYCDGLPWFVEAHENKSLFILTWGVFLPLEPAIDEPIRCLTKNRIMLYAGRPAKLLKVVCPLEPNAKQFAVHVFSEEWFGVGTAESPSTMYLQPHRPPNFLVEFINRESGIAAFSWLEISRSRSSLLQQLQIEFPTTLNTTTNDTTSAGLPPDWDCQYRCPELNACISSSLWCDGRINCPSGFDENESHCGVGRRIFNLFPGGVYTAISCTAAIIAAFILFLLVAAVHRIRARRRRRRLGKKKLINSDLGSMPRRIGTDEFLIDTGSTLSS